MLVIGDWIFMKREVVKINKPGKYNFVVSFDKLGQTREWVGIIDARKMGEYELMVVAQHIVPRTKGRVTVRAVVGAGAQVKIKGIIRIAKEAQETDDFLELRVLTLDKTALATADPELEIETNQVKASHATSVGPIDPEQLLYLRSRGLSKQQARNAVVAGWLGNDI